MEIERKFLVNRRPKILSRSARCRIRQGYFSLLDKKVQIRVRQNGSEYSIGIKAGSGVVRMEEEIQISADRFKRLWRLVCNASIEKIRHVIPYGKRTIQLDIYQGPHKGLLTAEVEFPTRSQSKKFRPPDWFGKEITWQHRYSNEAMARRSHV